MHFSIAVSNSWCLVQPVALLPNRLFSLCSPPSFNIMKWISKLSLKVKRWKMTLNTDSCLHLFSLQFIISSTYFGTPKKQCARLLYLTFTNRLKKILSVWEKYSKHIKGFSLWIKIKYCKYPHHKNSLH